MNRLGLKISCFVVSIVIWMQVASTADVEKTARLPVGIEGLRDGLTIAGSKIPGNPTARMTPLRVERPNHRQVLS